MHALAVVYAKPCVVFTFLATILHIGIVWAFVYVLQLHVQGWVDDCGQGKVQCSLFVYAAVL